MSVRHWFFAFAALLTISQTGCSIWPSAPAADNIILGRQHSLRGIAALRDQDYDGAEKWFAQSVNENPDDERGRAHYADLLWRRNKRSEALVHMSRALELSGGAVEYQVRLGEMHLALGEIETASKYALAAIATDKDSADAWALQGDCLRAQGELQTALARYHRALSIQTHFPRVQVAVADVYADLKKPQRSMATLAALIDQYPPATAPQNLLVRHSVALKAVGRMDQAVAMLELASKRGPETPQLLYQLAEAQFLAGDASNARVTLQRSIAIQPNHEPSHRLLADLNSRASASQWR